MKEPAAPNQIHWLEIVSSSINLLPLLLLAVCARKRGRLKGVEGAASRCPQPVVEQRVYALRCKSEAPTRARNSSSGVPNTTSIVGHDGLYVFDVSGRELCIVGVFDARA
jgi:hypothetical protein